MWININNKKPETLTRVLVCVENKYTNKIYITIAKYISSGDVYVEDCISDDCDDFYETIDGIDYAPEGWYESLTQTDNEIYINEKVLCWMSLPETPMIKY